MLISLLLIMIFGSGSAPELSISIPHLKKEVRQNVAEEVRKDTLLVLVKDYEKALKDYEKTKKKLKKRLNKAGTDRTVSTEVFLQYYDDFYNLRTSLISELVGYRMLFQDQLTEEEMQRITDDAIYSSKKERRRDTKHYEKASDKLEKVFLDINETNVKHIEDSTKLELVTSSLHAFESTVYSLVDEAKFLSEERQLTIDDKTATMEEIEELYERSNHLRYRAAREFATLREELIKNTDEHEWKAINKELKVFLKV